MSARHTSRAILLSAIRFPDPPPNPIEEAVVVPLVSAYQRNDPVPAPVVFEIPGGRFELLSGQHRVTAAKRAGFAELMCVVLDKAPTELDRIALQFRENAHRRRLNAVEKAELYARAMRAGSLNGKAVAKLFDASESDVSRCLHINARLVDPLKALVANLTLNPRMAYSLSRLESADQVPFHDANRSLPIDPFEAKIADHLDARGKPTKKPPVLVELPGIRATLQHDAAVLLQATKQLWQACKTLVERGLPVSDLPSLLRIQGN